MSPEPDPVNTIPVPIDKPPAVPEGEPLYDPHARMKVQTVSLKDAERIPYEPRTIVYNDDSGSATTTTEYGENKAIYAEQADIYSTIDSRFVSIS